MQLMKNMQVDCKKQKKGGDPITAISAKKAENRLQVKAVGGK